MGVSREAESIGTLLGNPMSLTDRSGHRAVRCPVRADHSRYAPAQFAAALWMTASIGTPSTCGSYASDCRKAIAEAEIAAPSWMSRTG